MPEFRQLSAEETARMASRPRVNHVDLTEYTQFLGQLAQGDWGELVLDAGDAQRTVKRRLTTAGKSLGKSIHYRRGGERTIRFELR